MVARASSPTFGSWPPVDFGKLMTADTEKWGKLIRTANIEPD